MSATDAAGGPLDEDGDGIAEGKGGSAALPRLSLGVWALIVAGILALAAIAAWIGLQMADDPVRWRNVGFTVDSPFDATATYDVFLYTDEHVICHVRALNVRFAEIGAATQDVLPAGGDQQRLTTAVSTTERANTVIVDYCEVAP